MALTRFIVAGRMVPASTTSKLLKVSPPQESYIRSYLRSGTCLRSGQEAAVPHSPPEQRIEQPLSTAPKSKIFLYFSKSPNLRNTSSIRATIHSVTKLMVILEVKAVL